MGLLRQIAKRGASLFIPWRSYMLRGPKHAQGLALTFDDGPDPEHTPRLLDLLDEFGWKGTFFVIGEKAERSPDLIKRIVTSGHSLGNHTYTHSEPSMLSTTSFLNEVKKTKQLLEDLSGCKVTTVRPPKGELTPGKMWGLLRSGYRTVMWSADPKDYKATTSEEAVRWCQLYRPCRGDIILLHDNQSLCLSYVRQLQAKLAHWVHTPIETIEGWLGESEPRR